MRTASEARELHAYRDSSNRLLDGPGQIDAVNLNSCRVGIAAGPEDRSSATGQSTPPPILDEDHPAPVHARWYVLAHDQEARSVLVHVESGRQL